MTAKRHCRVLLTLASLWALPAAGLLAQTIPSGCESIASQPATYAIDYQTDIQEIFNIACQNCHVNHAGVPESDLDLEPEPSWFNLVDVPSSQAPGQIRVVPRNALASLLFRKFNCDVPGPLISGGRMPLDRPPRPLAEQALIYDWIMAGAPFEPTDNIFFAGFEQRGFVP